MNKKIVYGAIALTFIVAVLALLVGVGSKSVSAPVIGGSTSFLPSFGVARLEVGTNCDNAYAATNCSGTSSATAGYYSASGGVVGGICSVSTAISASTLTLTNANLSGCETLSITSGTSTVTLAVTFPASSTMGTLANSGDVQHLVVYAASTTAGSIQFVAGTGFGLLSPLTVASTTAATTTIAGGGLAALDIVRLPTTDIKAVILPSK